MKTKPRWSLLFLTDLHYGSPDRHSDDAAKAPPGGNALRDDIFKKFHRIIENGFERESIDLIAVGGDITHKGEQSGFDDFKRDALPRLQNLIKTRNPRAICLVPGNHDVPKGLDPESSYDVKFCNFRRLVTESKATSCLFPSGSLKAETSLTFAAAKESDTEYGPIHIDHEHKVLAMCINSATRCVEIDTKMQHDLRDMAASLGIHELTPEQIDKIRPILSNILVRDIGHILQDQRNLLSNRLDEHRKKFEKDGTGWSNYLKIAVLHHHLIPFLSQQTSHETYTYLLDSSPTLKMLMGYGFDLVLSGHKHQPYQEIYLDDLVLVGGPTLGGAAKDTPQGFRYIEVEDKSGVRSFRISDIPLGLADGNVSQGVAECMKEYEEITVDLSEKKFKERSRAAGFYYRSVTSVTALSRNGDAKRRVEFEDLIYDNENCQRREQHTIALPTTSGRIDCFRATYDNDTKIKAEDLPRTDGRSMQKMLTFDSKIGSSTDKHESSKYYSIEWHAVNSFALNTYQWKYKYPKGKWPDQEFTHYTPEDPIEELTVLIKFPAPGVGLASAPQPRVVVVDPKEPDRRNWTIDNDAQNYLVQSKALKYFKVAGIAVLKVKYPQPNLSYGIQWEVEKARGFEDKDQGVIEKIWKRLKSPLTDQERRRLTDCLTSLITEARSRLLRNRDHMLPWDGQIDAGVKCFEGADSLVRLLAVNQEKRNVKASELVYDRKLKYGEGIAGNAFKMNRTWGYIYHSEQVQTDRPDWYVPILEGHKHELLISFPLHRPWSGSETRDYKRRPPYGVFSLGSTSQQCLLLKDIKEYRSFQNHLNATIWNEFLSLLTGI